jgi:hypothetical protein
MQTFTFFMLEAPCEVPGFVFGEFPNSEAALTYGRSLLTVRNGYRAVEVMEDDKLIALLPPAHAWTALCRHDHRSVPSICDSKSHGCFRSYGLTATP